MKLYGVKMDNSIKILEENVSGNINRLKTEKVETT